MQSPRDPKATLIRSEILPGLVAHTCPTTGGVWIDIVTYWDWFRTQPGFPKPTPSFESPEAAASSDDNDRPLLSPRSGRLMRKCRVGSGLAFRIDFEPGSGFWLDRDEYESLRWLNLHDELHLICSPEYQHELVRMQTSDAEHARFTRTLGEDACQRIEIFADWIHAQPNQQVAMSYLMSRFDDAKASDRRG